MGGWHARSVGAARQRSKRAQQGKSRGRWLLLCCALLVGTLIFLFTTRALRIRELRQQLASAQTASEQALVEREELDARLAEQDDLEAIEDAAREKLGWVLPGEERIIFVYETDDSSNEGD